MFSHSEIFNQVQCKPGVESVFLSNPYRRSVTSLSQLTKFLGDLDDSLAAPFIGYCTRLLLKSEDCIPDQVHALGCSALYLSCKEEGQDVNASFLRLLKFLNVSRCSGDFSFFLTRLVGYVDIKKRVRALNFVMDIYERYGDDEFFMGFCLDFGFQDSIEFIESIGRCVNHEIISDSRIRNLFVETLKHSPFFGESHARAIYDKLKLIDINVPRQNCDYTLAGAVFHDVFSAKMFPVTSVDVAIDNDWLDYIKRLNESVDFGLKNTDLNGVVLVSYFLKGRCGDSSMLEVVMSMLRVLNSLGSASSIIKMLENAAGFDDYLKQLVLQVMLLHTMATSNTVGCLMLLRAGVDPNFKFLLSNKTPNRYNVRGFHYDARKSHCNIRELLLGDSVLKGMVSSNAYNIALSIYSGLDISKPFYSQVADQLAKNRGLLANIDRKLFVHLDEIKRKAVETLLLCINRKKLLPQAKDEMVYYLVRNFIFPDQAPSSPADRVAARLSMLS